MILKYFISLNANYRKFRKLIKKFSESDKKDVVEAFEFAKKWHGKQMRDEDVPYIIHPVRVANILMEELNYYDPDVIISALLHDVVEDTSIKVKDIGDRYGREVRRLVIGLTRIKSRETKYAKFKKTAKADYRTRVLKCADVLDNIRSWPLSTKKYKYTRWFKEVRDLYLPLAQNTDKHLCDEMKKLINSKKYKDLLVKFK
ncbi:HD domain-containing protein [Patescibacteria group bacterium]|nr:HD domain-containing protein [Patescibacteria group bacterium]